MAFSNYVRQRMDGIRLPEPYRRGMNPPTFSGGRVGTYEDDPGGTAMSDSAIGPVTPSAPTGPLTQSQMEEQYRREGNAANHAAYKEGPLPAETLQVILALLAMMQQGMAAPRLAVAPGDGTAIPNMPPPALPAGLFGGGAFSPMPSPFATSSVMDFGSAPPQPPRPIRGRPY